MWVVRRTKATTVAGARLLAEIGMDAEVLPEGNSTESSAS